ncbi:MAG: hypothetical protein ACOXZ7_03315 [Sphaerochaeta sp.]
MLLMLSRDGSLATLVQSGARILESAAASASATTRAPVPTG